LANKISNRLHEWLERVSSNEEPSDSIVAFNIGLFEIEDGEYSVYLIGAIAFDESNEDWACSEAFSPSERYCILPDVAGYEWSVVLDLLAEAVKEFIDSIPGRSSFIGSARAVTVGFDSGELVRVK